MVYTIRVLLTRLMMVMTMNKHTDELLQAVHEISAIIYYQSSLKEQDRWLADIMEKGIWLPEDDD